MGGSLNTDHVGSDIHQLHNLLHTSLCLDEAYPHHDQVQLQTLEHGLLLDGKPCGSFLVSDTASDRHPDRSGSVGRLASQ